jgi:diguanylate cyclase (GGDEF)-like protein
VSPAVDELIRLRDLLARGHSLDALHSADRVLHAGPTPAQRADALLLRLGAMINLGRRAEYTLNLDAAAEAVRDSPQPERYGQLYAFAAIIAGLDDSLDRCVTYLVKSARMLGQTDQAHRDIACAWHDLAMAYSYIGFHGYALSAIERARRIALRAGAGEADFVVPAIRVRLAVWHDHHGDTDACKRVLRDVIDDLAWHQRIQPDGIRPISQGAYGYAAARLAALGDPVTVDPRPLLDRAGNSLRARDLRLLGDVCLKIGGDAPARAIEQLAQATVAAATLGGAEPHRLRALAYLAAGQPAEALTADRRAFRIASAQVERLRERYVDGMAARLDHEEPHRPVPPGAQPLADPLTGLASRGLLDQRIAALNASGGAAVLAICDLDGLASVNEAHGRLTGDLVIQRVAMVLGRVMRRGDLVARYGGDQFAVLLLGAGPEEAREVGQRLQSAVRDEDWAALVPGAAVTARVWYTDVTAAPAAEPVTPSLVAEGLNRV